MKNFCEERAWARVAELEDVIVALLPAFSNDTATAAQLRKIYADTILKAEELTANELSSPAAEGSPSGARG